MSSFALGITENKALPQLIALINTFTFLLKTSDYIPWKRNVYVGPELFILPTRRLFIFHIRQFYLHNRRNICIPREANIYSISSFISHWFFTGVPNFSRLVLLRCNHQYILNINFVNRKEGGNIWSSTLKSTLFKTFQAHQFDRWKHRTLQPCIWWCYRETVTWFFFTLRQLFFALLSFLVFYVANEAI